LKRTYGAVDYKVLGFKDPSCLREGGPAYGDILFDMDHVYGTFTALQNDLSEVSKI
jgi:hypothetical protein